MSQQNLTRPVQQHPAVDDSNITDADYLRAVEAHQAKIVAELDRQAEAYRRRHPEHVA